MNINTDHAPDTGFGSPVWLWMVLPLAPFALGFACLTILQGDAFNLAKNHVDAVAKLAVAAGLNFFGELAVYVSVMMVQVASCLAVITVAVLRFLDGGAVVQRRMLSILVVLIVVLAAIFVREHIGHGPALIMTYHNTCALIVEAKVATHIVPSKINITDVHTCFSSGKSVLALLVNLPLAMGLIGMSFIAAATGSDRELQAADAATMRQAFEDRVRRMDRDLIMASVMMVTSTTALLLFYRFPIALFADELLKTEATLYAQGMTLIWGTVFTLTLATTFAPTVYRQHVDAKRLAYLDPEITSSGRWLSMENIQTTQRLAAKVATYLAPMLVGPAAALLERLGG